MKKRFKETGDPSVIREAHRVGIDLEYCQIEKLANLDQLPRPYGFKVACFPVKLTGGSAGWTRSWLSLKIYNTGSFGKYLFEYCHDPNWSHRTLEVSW